MYTHVPVLLNEVIESLNIKQSGCYLDGTVGLGGHSRAILEKSEGTVFLLGLDRDLEALTLAEQNLLPFANNICLQHSRFSDFKKVLDNFARTANHKNPLFDGVLLDLGISSLQLDKPERGFSFKQNGPLDMRMNQSGLSVFSDLHNAETSAFEFQGLKFKTAFDFINRVEVKSLAKVIEEYGEEPLAYKIAKAIVEVRDKAEIVGTMSLAKIIENAYPAKWRAKARNHPATRTFQALRILVNAELVELQSFLDNIIKYMSVGARIAIISFHSLEDRIVKNKFKESADACRCPKHLPYCVCKHIPELKLITKKPIYPSDQEVKLNSRASCAKLRVAEKL